MAWAMIVLGVIAVVEMFMACPFLGIVRELLQVANKSSRALTSSKISDHWKERVMPIYARQLLIHTANLFFWLLVIFSPFFLLIFIGNFYGIDILPVLSSITGIFLSTGLGVLYGVLRTRFHN